MAQGERTRKPEEWKALVAEDRDLVKGAVQEALREVLEAEMDEALRAGEYGRTAERQGYRSGYCGRQLLTRVGTIELRVPQDRAGRFSTEAFERYRRSEKALVCAWAEMYVQGVSTRSNWSHTTPETVAYLVRLGATLNDKADGGSTVLQTCLRHFGSHGMDPDDWYRNVKIPASRLGSSLTALRFLLEQGGRWTPDERTLADTRRALYRVEDEAAVAVVDLLRAHQACDDAVLKVLTRTPKMRAIFATVAHRRTGADVRTKPRVGGRAPRNGR